MLVSLWLPVLPRLTPNGSRDHVIHVRMLSSKGHQLYIPFRNFLDSSFCRLGAFYSPSSSLGPTAVPCTAACPLHIPTPRFISHPRGVKAKPHSPVAADRGSLAAVLYPASLHFRWSTTSRSARQYVAGGGGQGDSPSPA